MLSVDKIGAGQERYYLDTVASGLEDYYSGRGESPGTWSGSAAKHLDLVGRVDADDLGAVLSGRDPMSRTPLGQVRKDRVPGFDLTFSPPKSVSVLWGLGDLDTAREVRAAHDAAVEAALGWLERNGCRSRRGVDGHERVEVDGFVMAKFVHRSSRAGDPQLHTHVLVANLARCEDGKWRALDGKVLLWQAHTAGYLYKAHLRHELTRRLGVDWGPIHKGAAEIVGIAPELCEMFSTRRHEIEDELDARGLHSAKAAEAAALVTRRAKDHTPEPATLHSTWWDRAREAGHELTRLNDALGRVALTPIDDHVTIAGTDTLLGVTGVTQRSSVFDERDVLRGWCEQLPQGAPVEVIEGLAAATLHDDRVVALTHDQQFPKCSTAEVLALEHRLVTGALGRADTERAMVPEAALRAALDARLELSPEQVAAVAEMTTSGNGLEVVVAAAGTGKTFCLDAAHDAWHRAGHRVIGAALAATAAAQLQAQTAIPSDTIALRALQLADGTLQLDDHTVVVIDEAAMVGTRHLAVFLDAAASAGAKLVLIGDPRQLNAIDAGGLLDGLAKRLTPVTLHTNRRQRDKWERTALTQLRRGDIDSALAHYDEHDRVVTADTAIDLRNHMAADWHAATLAGEKVVMLAERRHDVDDLNHRARRRRDLQGPTLAVRGRRFQTGDRVLCLRNDRRLGVHNGTLATITGLDAEQRVVMVRTDAGTVHELPARYLDAGHLTHGYAMTIHKSQGLTVDRCFVLASDTLDHNAGYTALSRGKAENRIYVHGALPGPEAHHVERHTLEPRDQLAVALRRDRHDRLAIDHLDAPAIRDELRALLHEHARLTPVRHAMPPDARPEIAALTQQRADLATRVAQWRARLDDTRPGVRHRRHRLATRLAAERGRDLSTRRLADIERALDQAHADQRRYVEYQRAHDVELHRLAELDTHIEDSLDRLVTIHAANPPQHLRTLGPYPKHAARQDMWRRAAVSVERYRTQHDITDPHNALGPIPDNPDAWRAARRALQGTARILTPTGITRGVEREIGLDLGIDP
jgi:conjugative relaxase-like TrwC/TraI family protein